MDRGKQRPQRTNNNRRALRQTPARQPRSNVPRAEGNTAQRPVPARRPFVPEARPNRRQSDPFSPYAAQSNSRQRSPQDANTFKYSEKNRPYYGTAQSQAYDYSNYSSADPYQEQDNYYSSYPNYQKPRNTLGGDPYDHLQPNSDWTKWIVTVVSGIIFIVCVIILIILLT